MELTIEQYEKIQPMLTVSHRGKPLRYTIPNRMTKWRVETMFKKEPDTIAWLDSFTEGSSFLDIGANMGLYTVYAAVMRGCRVVGFEPESQNYALLNRNIHLNNLSGRVKAYCAAAMAEIKLDSLYLSSFDYHGGGSCHSFGAEVGFDLQKRVSPFAQGCISIDLDQAVGSGMLDVPDYIKIDVDGFEHKVIEGALQTLGNPNVRELLIEVNPHLEAHQLLMAQLQELDFHFDEAQFKRAARKDGAFEGVGEIIFRRKAKNASIHIAHTFVPEFLRTNLYDAKETAIDERTVLDHVLERISQAKIIETPFPHIVVDNVFPEAYYRDAIAHFPRDPQLIPLSQTGRTSGYDERLVALFNDAHFQSLEAEQRKFWTIFGNWLYSERFINEVIHHFSSHVDERIRLLASNGQLQVHGDALLVSDKTKYAIGPHTDAAHRLITFLFYMPENDSQRELGTSLYEPKEASFRCRGGPHYAFEHFNKLSTVEYLPNRALIFVRTDQSFHGVEEITRGDVNRHLLINNIRIAHTPQGN